MLKKFIFYLKYAFPFFILQKDIPLILGLVINDRCNLTCKHCRVSNRAKPDLTMKGILNRLERYYQIGFRELYIEGGEPFLWNDGKYILNDVVDKAKEIGYFHVHIYTNGLFPLKSHADFLWVSVDGLKEEYAKIRGDHFEKVIRNIKKSTHPKICIVYTINTINKEAIKRFLIFTQNQQLNNLGVVFFFHTPYYGYDELFIDFEDRRDIIEKIIQYKRMKLPVFNSYAGLNALKSGKWKRPNRFGAMTDIDGDYICCRFRAKNICENCGYCTFTEITEAQKLKFSAIRNLLKF